MAYQKIYSLFEETCLSYEGNQDDHNCQGYYLENTSIHFGCAFLPENKIILFLYQMFAYVRDL